MIQNKPEGSPYSRHLPALDGVRGIAILGVMASHLFAGNARGGHLLNAIGIGLPYGATGVDLFFTLSGFLITGILFDSLAEPHFFRKFYARRCLRIFPLYYGVLLIVLLLSPWFGIDWRHELWSLALYLQNTNLIATPINQTTTGFITLDHFWSLAVEEQFYLIWPLAVYRFRRQRTLLWACLAMFLVAMILRFGLGIAHVPYLVINSNTVCRSDSLLAGGALALLLRGRYHDATLRAGRWFFLIGAIAFFLVEMVARSLPANPNSPYAYAALLTLHYSLLAIASSGLIAWSLLPSVAARIFKAPILRFFGKYSYGLYVLHLIAYNLLRPHLRALAERINPGKGFIVAVSGFLALGISIALAYASYHLYERHFLKLKRFFDYRREPEPRRSEA